MRLAGDDGDVPWCAIFVNAMLELVDIRGSRSGMARSFASDRTNFRRMSGPALGAICVLSSSRGPTSGHVGFYVGETEDGQKLKLLGGNQNDAVNEAFFPLDKLVGFYWPKDPRAPSPVRAAIVLGGSVPAGTVSDA